MIFCHRSLHWLTAAFVMGGIGQAIAQSAPLGRHIDPGTAVEEHLAADDDDSGH